MTWYVRVTDSETNAIVYTESTSDHNDALNLANKWYNDGYDTKVYEGE